MCSYVVTKHIFKSIIKALSDIKLLALAKPFGGIRPVVIGEVLYWLVSRTFCF
jgi:hypothetical protein